MRDILRLRLLAVAAALANMTFAYNGEFGPNWIPIFWQGVLASINIIWSLKLIRERSSVRFSPEQRELYKGDFVGEMSFIRGGGASADVRCISPNRYIGWPKQALKDLLARNPAMPAALQTVFSEDLTRKLAGG
ncbi:MAG: hypothetical protein HOI95_19515 [Chromatiales bacterium]|nr:hypothetical protein [Chromatiales bacterium]